MVKVKVSYEQEKELQKVLKILSPAIKSYRVPKGSSGRFKKAYIELKV